MKKSDFEKPNLTEIVKLLNQKGGNYFEMFQASIISSTLIDFKNMGLSTQGLGGKTCIIDVGDIFNILDPSLHETYFCVDEICNRIGKNLTLIGAGAADSAVFHGTPAELIMNGNLSRAAYIKGQRKFCVKYTSSDIQALGNFFGCEGKQSCNILAIEANTRLKDVGFCEAIQLILQEMGDIGLGGMFTVNSHSNSTCSTHIIKTLPEIKLRKISGLESHIDIFQTPLPVSAVTTIITDENKRKYGHVHSHFWSTGGREVIGGHFRIDDCPETVTYKGYFSLAEKYYYFS